MNYDALTDVIELARYLPEEAKEHIQYTSLQSLKVTEDCKAAYNVTIDKIQDALDALKQAKAVITCLKKNGAHFFDDVMICKVCRYSGLPY